MDNTLYRKRMVATDGLPKERACYDTDLGLLLWQPEEGKWNYAASKDAQFPEYWLDPIEVKPGMSLQECKNEVAKKWGYPSFEKMIEFLGIVEHNIKLHSVVNELCELYASSQLSAVISENKKLREELEGYKEAHEDKQKICREIEKTLCGDEGARQPSLCDIQKSVEDLKSQADKLAEALDGLLNHNEGSGCPMCDNGVLRDQNKQHWNDCNWDNARAALREYRKENHHG